MKKWQLIGTTTALSSALVLGACGGAADKAGSGDSKSGSNDKKLSGEVKGDGSSTVAPVMEKINEDFSKENPDVSVSIGVSGTGGGFEKFIAGETDFSNASRDIKDEEKDKLKKEKIDYTEFKVAQDGLTVAVNKENDFVKELSMDELAKIYSGKAKTWKDVNPKYPNKKIKAFSPDQSHGTYDFFSEEVLDEKDLVSEKNADTNVIVKSVQDNKDSIGFFGFNFYQENKDSLKAVKIKDDGKAVKPSDKTINDSSYPLSRPLFVYAKNKSLEDNKAFYGFMEYVIDNSKGAAKDAGYVALKDEEYKKDKKTLEKFKK
ncbi:PstS family phosphate ABC transporter substrate-binding protein [Mammaliicoccus stepanovicii]|uniref:Phosphate-binding protein n=1 Tax=Mammaliicoccus stepanovicii TaxID=643214 RepID=A0A239Z577_9STAP|nr:PstS family phosphate ABC transporter substrate-binding protein [Mammaliicoccus stepanovicii]PNZ72754.1 thioredoxine reductase [Mammaliicoccus stepanovicii]GGI40032.1 phosphate-binding protein PstS [Mammaliicoccus stepanovicii]SNV66459.1 phosphate ABC transporter substrate-binding protein [Mammaliicoccus stepanovicii]